MSSRTPWMVQIGMCVLLATPSAWAQSAEAASPDAIFGRYGLGDGEGCLQFVDRVAVDFRKEQWLRAIQEIWRTDPAYVTSWIVGATEPPRRVIAESEKQRDCMVTRMFVDASQAAVPLVVDWQDSRAAKRQMPELSRRFRQDHAFARRIIRAITESAYRNARTQSRIWKRKYRFSGRNFNVVSPVAAKACGIEEGSTWKPASGTHRECWNERLEPAQREHEILQASAAPGISRHHWGTDFDLFGLSPAKFATGGRSADEYRWMANHAVEFGFFQPYTSNDDSAGHRYMEERWHWSYYPVGQALLEFARAHDDAVGQALEAQWDAFETQWNAGTRRPDEFFGFVRAHWREFMFNVDDLHVRTRPKMR